MDQTSLHQCQKTGIGMDEFSIVVSNWTFAKMK
jgi:hypothetical protein